MRERAVISLGVFSVARNLFLGVCLILVAALSTATASGAISLPPNTLPTSSCVTNYESPVAVECPLNAGPSGNSYSGTVNDLVWQRYYFSAQANTTLQVTFTDREDPSCFGLILPSGWNSCGAIQAGIADISNSDVTLPLTNTNLISAPVMNAAGAFAIDDPVSFGATITPAVTGTTAPTDWVLFLLTTYNMPAPTPYTLTVSASPSVQWPPPSVLPPIRRATQCVVPTFTPGRTSLGVVEGRIRAAHCRVGRITRATSKSARRGSVLRLSSKPGARLARGSRVGITVSAGK